MNANSINVRTQDGRTIHIIDAGPAGGIPVVVHHGTPGSARLYGPAVEDAQRRGLRLIGYDRPGYGGSTPRPGRAVADAAEDVAAIAKAMDLKRLLTWGHSGGGPHALACAALLPDLVAAAAALSAPAPYWGDATWLEGMGEDNVHEFGAALESREAVEKFVEAFAPGMLNADAKSLVEAMRTLLSPPDVAALTESLADHLIEQVREGVMGRRDGWIDDDLAFTRPWGFDPESIRVPVLILQGEQDKMVPFEHGRQLARHTPAAEVRLLPEEGHLTMLTARLPEVHAWLLEKWK